MWRTGIDSPGFITPSTRNRRGVGFQYIEQDKGYETPCWIWQWSFYSNGYGKVWWEDKPQRAHRVAYKLRFGEIPEGKELHHLCLQEACVNPDHLEPTSHQDNCQRNRGQKDISELLCGG